MEQTWIPIQFSNHLFTFPHSSTCTHFLHCALTNNNNDNETSFNGETDQKTNNFSIDLSKYKYKQLTRIGDLMATTLALHRLALYE